MGGGDFQEQRQEIIIELPPDPPAPWYEATWIQIVGGAILAPLLVAYITRRLWRRSK